MDGGVYNRRLFRRKDSAKDGLRLMGGIMASSPELMAAAQESMVPMGTGQGRVIFPIPSIVGMPTSMEMMQSAPPAPMPEPAPPMPMPVQAPQQQGAPAPAPVQFADGGSVAARGQAAARSVVAGNPILNASVGLANTFSRAISPSAPQVSGPTSVEEKMAQISSEMSDPALPPEKVSTVVADTMAKELGMERTGDTRQDINNIAQSLGISNPHGQTVDSLNRAIMGAAIAAGRSPSASENIANGMLEGLRLMRETETLRETAVAEAQAKALVGNEQGATWFDTPRGKLATEYVAQQGKNEKDIETIIAELNQIDANSPPGSKLGDEFRAALAAGASPPGATGPVAQPAPVEGAATRDMDTLVSQANSVISRINASNMSPEEKSQRIAAVRATFVQLGGNPSLLNTGQ